jgi:phosphoribosylformylglycinamidine cyclo-ligase
MSNAYLQEVIKRGNDVSRIGRAVCEASLSNCKAVHIVTSSGSNDFRAGVGYLWKDHILERMAHHTVSRGRVIDWDMMETAENDGAGGKPQFFTFLNTYQSFYRLGWEVVVMCAEDVVRRGGFPCIMLNQADMKGVNKKNVAKVRAFFQGYSDALKTAGLINITGETAIMKDSITAFCDTGDPTQLILTLSGACIGLLAKEKMFSKENVRPNMPIVGLHERGYRCNGGGVFTRIIREIWGSDMKKAMENEDAQKFVRLLTVASTYYGRDIAALHGWKRDGRTGKALVPIHEVGHITGGGFWERVEAMLPEGVGARFDTMPIPPPALLRGYELSQRTSQPISEWSAYQVFHGACGMMFITEHSALERTLGLLHRCGIGASLVGHTASSPSGEIILASRFSKEGRILSSLDPF